MTAVRMRRSLWTYPWDVQDLGLDYVLGELRDRAGANTVSLATSYHAGRFLQPRSPVRKCYFPQDGTIYFEPTPSLWDGHAITPQVASIVRAGGDVLGDLVRQRDAGGLGVSCWTVCLHNMRLGLIHPSAVTRNAFGDPNPFSLCPSNDEARAYVRTLVADVSRRYRPDMVELESPGFMGYAHGYHHEKDGVGLTPEDDFLLSLCFCDACTTRAGKAGVDVAAARDLTRTFIAEACERPVPSPRFPDFPASGPGSFEAYPALDALIRWRFEPVTSLVAEIRAEAHPDTTVTVIDLADGWLGGGDLAALGKACDGAILCAYDMSAEATGSLLRQGRAILGADKFLGTGFRLFYPEMSGPEAIRSRVAAAVAEGVDSINFYNYGLVPAARLDWIAS
jgi:hypothetical protein